jgi:hypothetical protein
MCDYAVDALTRRRIRGEPLRPRTLKYQRLRDLYPDGRYKAGADIAPEEWLRLTLAIDRPATAISVQRDRNDHRHRDQGLANLVVTST